MQKIIRIVGVVVGVLLALIVLAAGTVYAVSEMRLNQHFDVPTRQVRVPDGPDAIAEGKRQFAIRACGDCHGSDLGGVVFIDSPAGWAMGANLTSGEGGIGATYSAADWVRAIRHGVRPNGKGIAVMPATDYFNMSDADLGNLIAYIRSAPPVDRMHKPMQIGLLFRALYLAGQAPLLSAEVVDHRAEIAQVTPRASIEYGKYLSQTCTGCHTPTFAGGPILGRPEGSAPAANLTPAGNLRMWSELEFIETLRTGLRPNGEPINPADMPWPSFAHMTDTELKALYMYLNSLPPAQPKK